MPLTHQDVSKIIRPIDLKFDIDIPFKVQNPLIILYVTLNFKPVTR